MLTTTKSSFTNLNTRAHINLLAVAVAVINSNNN